MKGVVGLCIMLLALVAAGCGSSAPAPKNLAAACSQADRETASIARRRFGHGSGVMVISSPKQQAAARRQLEQATSEFAGVDRAAAAAIRRLPQTKATRTALVDLTSNEKLLAEIPGEEGFGRLSLLSAMGSCRRLRAAIGG